MVLHLQNKVLCCWYIADQGYCGWPTWMSSMIQEERGCSSTWVMGVIVGKLKQRKVFIPIILQRVHKTSEGFLVGSVESLCHCIGCGVIWG